MSSLLPSQIPNSLWENENDPCNGHSALCNCVLVAGQLWATSWFSSVTVLNKAFFTARLAPKASGSFYSDVCSLGTGHVQASAFSQSPQIIVPVNPSTLLENLIRQDSPPEAWEQSECLECLTWEFLFISKLHAVPVEGSGEGVAWPEARTEEPEVQCGLCTGWVQVCLRTITRLGNLEALSHIFHIWICLTM